MVQNKAFMYHSIPQGIPVAGKDLSIEDIGFDENAPPPKNGITTKNLMSTYDPTQRVRMRDPSIKSYSQAMIPGNPVTAIQVFSKVLKSDNERFKPGDPLMISIWRTESYSSIDSKSLDRAFPINLPEGIPMTAYASALGMTGMTAYGSLKEIGKPKKGDVILISAAAGAVGQMVGQFAIKEGCHVIGSVGDDKKLEFITKDLGFHSGFNYKKEDMSEAIKRLAPDGVDIYFDNVGGELLDAVLPQMTYQGRIIACGSISRYNSKPEDVYGLKNYSHIVTKSLTMRGFIVMDKDIDQWKKERDQKVTEWIQKGELKMVNDITDGMDNAIDGFLGMLSGKNLGRSLLKIADD